MADWRFMSQWSEQELIQRIHSLDSLPYNYVATYEEMTAKQGWTVDGIEEVIGTESPGRPVPGGTFERARQGIVNYDFSDPRIVVGHFDPHVPLQGRNMLLELKVLGFRLLTGVRVHAVREESDKRGTTFGFRYDTLEGHIEQGAEWFVLTKDHLTGEVRFRIEARWRVGRFPNWWTRVGFLLIGEYYRSTWRHRAPSRLRELAHKPVEAPTAEPGQLAHRGDPEPTRTDTAA